MGVKQGGVLSPILFNMCLDVLLLNLQKSGFGCHIGNEFMGCFAYADDIILLSPTCHGINKMFDICDKYSHLYSLTFNKDKTKVIIFDDKHDAQSFLLCNNCINVSKCEKHLGVLIGRKVNKLNIVNSISELTCLSNYMCSVFKDVQFDIKYQLFKTFCMPLYGSVLWDFSNADMTLLFSRWRVCVKRLLRISPLCHSNLLHWIVNDIPVDMQLYKRFIKFLKHLYTTNNYCISLCARLAIGGSGSSVSNNLTVLSDVFHTPRYTLPEYEIDSDVGLEADYEEKVAGNIRDLLSLRDSPNSSFTFSELNDMITFLCSS